MTSEKKLTPRPAATLLLLREADAAPEVFMLQRTSKAAFLPGAFVFPGGALDPDDASERAAQRVRGLDDAQASVRMGLASGGLAYWIAAARECFEESGILLVFDSKDLPIDPRRAENLEPFRNELNAGSLQFSEFLEKEDLYIHAHDRSETVHSVWISPREALERGKRGEIELIFPTRSTLSDLASIQTPRAVLEWLKGRSRCGRAGQRWIRSSRGIGTTSR